jgi:hypothetical protein
VVKPAEDAVRHCSSALSWGAEQAHLHVVRIRDLALLVANDGKAQLAP